MDIEEFCDEKSMKYMLSLLLHDTTLLNLYPLTRDDFVQCKMFMITDAEGIPERGDYGEPFYECADYPALFSVIEACKKRNQKNVTSTDVTSIRALQNIDPTQWAKGATLKNIDFYYQSIKRHSLIRKLQKSGLDVSKYTAEYQFGDFSKYSCDDIIADFTDTLNKISVAFKASGFDPFVGYAPDQLPDVLAKESIEWLVDGLFVKNAFHEICGPSKSGKSQFAYQLAYCIQNGKEFFGQKCQQTDVLYVDWELMQLEICDRYNQTKMFYEDNTPLPYQTIPLYGTDYSIGTVLERVGTYLKDHPKIEVVFFDNWYSFFDGNNNDSSDVKKTLKMISGLAPNVTKFLVCHTNKADGKDGGNKDPIFSAAGSNAFGAFAHEIASIENRSDGKIVRVSGRMVYPTQAFACKYGPDTHFQFRVIEDESTRSKLLSGKTGKTKAELLSAYPELCSFIGDEGKTIAAIQKQFPEETDASLKEKGFYTERNKERLRQGFVSGRWYCDDPRK